MNPAKATHVGINGVAKYSQTVWSQSSYLIFAYHAYFFFLLFLAGGSWTLVLTFAPAPNSRSISASVGVAPSPPTSFPFLAGLARVRWAMESASAPCSTLTVVCASLPLFFLESLEPLGTLEGVSPVPADPAREDPEETCLGC